MTTDTDPTSAAPAPATVAPSGAALAVARFVVDDLIVRDRAGRFDVRGIAARTAVAAELLAGRDGWAALAREVGLPSWAVRRLRQQMRAVIAARCRQAA